MITAIKNRLLFLPALLLSLPLALAQAPSGPVSFTFDAATFPVWDFTGAYQFDQEMVETGGALLPLSFQVFITHGLSGRLSGAGTTIVTMTVGQGQDVVTNYLAANYVLEGTVSGGGAATRATFAVTMAGGGLDVIAGARRSYHISLTYNLGVDPELLAWVVGPHAVRGVVGISGLGSASVSGGGFTVPLPPGVTGKWGVYMDILLLGRLGGAAMIVINSSAPPDQAAYLPDTRTLNAGLVGAYKPARGSQVQITGRPGSTPATLQLTLDGQTQLVRIAGKVLGQTVSYTKPSAAP
jgi:hypothetical protein